MVIDHIGIVVCSLEDGIKQWEEMFGYRVASEVVLNAHQEVQVVFLARPGSVPVKLVQPVGVGSSVAAFARRGGGLHHICFRCDDLKVEIPRLKSKGARLMVPPRPGEAFNNRDIAFLLAKNNLNIELVDTTEKTGWRETPADLQVSNALASIGAIEQDSPAVIIRPLISKAGDHEIQRTRRIRQPKSENRT